MSNIYSRRDFLKKMADLGICLGLTAGGVPLAGCSDETDLKNDVTINGDQKFERVILLGMDGLDPKVLSHLMLRGSLPNFLKLSRMDAYAPLATSNPPQSPVAWASIATGNNPGYHGIYDFLNRRIDGYVPELAVVKANPHNFLGLRRSNFLPVMRGSAFWDYTSSLGVDSTIIRWPVTFQPKQNRARLYSGLGVPDLKGGLGKYSLYTTRFIPGDSKEIDKVMAVMKLNNEIVTYISGPETSGGTAKADLNISILEGGSGIKINVDGESTVAHYRRWSEWVPVSFRVGRMNTVTGIVKFYLNSVEPEFELYMTPVQINPKDPAFVISSPDNYIRDLANELGYFFTLGISEDTNAFSDGALDEEAFITMCDEITEEQEDMLRYELNGFGNGVLSFGFFSSDRIQHMFWAARDPEHPLYNRAYAAKYGHVIDDYYVRMDRVLGEVLEHVNGRTAIMVFSDHGFDSFRRNVHLNSWLAENGFMKLDRTIDRNDSEGGALFQYVDWKNTYAYALGFGGIYLNLKGREQHGIVEPGAHADTVKKEMARKLLRLKDPKHGQMTVKNVYYSSDIYSAGHPDKSPDLIAGFQKGYRASWQTAIGGSPAGILDDNLKKWSGDHIMDPSIVPGILLTNFKINNLSPNLMDIAPTVLDCFGMSVPGMEGKALT